MRMSHLMIMGALLAYATAAATAEPLAADEMGLSKTSVFDTPTPDAFAYPDAQPRQSTMLPRAYGGFGGAPPQIPHAIDAFMPITAGNNACAACHDRPHLIGRAYRKGRPHPYPAATTAASRVRVTRRPCPGPTMYAPSAMCPSPVPSLWWLIPVTRVVRRGGGPGPGTRDVPDF